MFVWRKAGRLGQDGALGSVLLPTSYAEKSGMDGTRGVFA